MGPILLLILTILKRKNILLSKQLFQRPRLSVHLFCHLPFGKKAGILKFVQDEAGIIPERTYQ